MKPMLNFKEPPSAPRSCPKAEPQAVHQDIVPWATWPSGKALQAAGGHLLQIGRRRKPSQMPGPVMESMPSEIGWCLREMLRIHTWEAGDPSWTGMCRAQRALMKRMARLNYNGISCKSLAGVMKGVCSPLLSAQAKPTRACPTYAVADRCP